MSGPLHKKVDLVSVDVEVGGGPDGGKLVAHAALKKIQDKTGSLEIEDAEIIDGLPARLGVAHPQRVVAKGLPGRSARRPHCFCPVMADDDQGDHAARRSAD